MTVFILRVVPLPPPLPGTGLNSSHVHMLIPGHLLWLIFSAFIILHWVVPTFFKARCTSYNWHIALKICFVMIASCGEDATQELVPVRRGCETLAHAD